ncbi:heparin lyase I family protein [Streptomyces sp. NPDC090053]|uniref:heparin lyase I family protein n=1 Tax=Streptomyces sp. NPDC090053 TaxID=3365932 RepID=UPI0037F1BD4A
MKHRRNRPVMAMVSAVAAAAALTLAGTWHASAGQETPTAFAARTPHTAAPLWRADPARGTTVFEGTETKPGAVSVVADPRGRYGSTYRLTTSGQKISDTDRVRVETRGHRTPDGKALRFTEGDTVYVGWRSMWGPLPTTPADWVVLWQLKDYGTGAATPPLSLRARGDGTVDLEYCDPDLKTTQLWHAPLRTGQWHSFVVGITVSASPSKGAVRFWYDGKQQKVKGGSAFRGATLRGDWVTDKWGVYRSDGVKGAATAYLNGAKVATSYALAAP